MNKQSGMATFKAVLAIAAFAALIFLAIKLVPPFINNYQLQDEINAVARFSTYAQGKTVENIRDEVILKGKETGIALKEDQVQVEKTTYGVNIDVKYAVVVEVPGYTFNLKFNPTAGNKMITAR